jgi:hypothetical protein
MNMDLKQKIAQNAWLIALLAGAIVFGIAYNLLTGQAGWAWGAALLAAAILFVAVAAGVWLIANNVVDAYSLAAADDAQNVYRLIARIRQAQRQIQDRSLASALGDICKHTTDLVAYTRQKQPNNLLSCCTVLEKWLDMIVNTTLSQVLDLQAHPEYHKDSATSLAKAQQGFDGFNAFLLNSIKTITDGDNMEFENAAKMLDASRFIFV